MGKENAIEMGRKYNSQAELYPAVSDKERISFEGIKTKPITIDKDTPTLSRALSKGIDEYFNSIGKAQLQWWVIPDQIVRIARTAGLNVDKVHPGDVIRVENNTFFIDMANGQKFRIPLSKEATAATGEGEVLAQRSQIKDSTRAEWETILEADMTKILYDSMLARGIKFTTENRKRIWSQLSMNGDSYIAAMREHGSKRLIASLDADKDFLSKKYVGSSEQHLAMIEYLRTYGLDELLKEVENSRSTVVIPETEISVKLPDSTGEEFDDSDEGKKNKAFTEMLNMATAEVGHGITASIRSADPAEGFSGFVPIHSPSLKYGGKYNRRNQYETARSAEDINGFIVEVTVPGSKIVDSTLSPNDVEGETTVTHQSSKEYKKNEKIQTRFLLVFDKDYIRYQDISISLGYLRNYAETGNLEDAPDNLYAPIKTKNLENVIGSEFVKAQTSKIGKIVDIPPRSKSQDAANKIPLYKIDVTDGANVYEAFVHADDHGFLIGTEVDGVFKNIRSAFMENPDEIKDFIIKAHRAAEKGKTANTEASPQAEEKTPAKPEENIADYDVKTFVEAAKSPEFKGAISINRTTEKNGDSKVITGTYTIVENGKTVALPVRILAAPNDYRLDMNRYGFKTDTDNIGKTTAKDSLKELVESHEIAIKSHNILSAKLPKLLSKEGYNVEKANNSEVENLGVYEYEYSSKGKENIKISLNCDASYTSFAGGKLSVSAIIGSESLGEGTFEGSIQDIQSELFKAIEKHSAESKLNKDWEKQYKKFHDDIQKEGDKKTIEVVNNSGSTIKFNLPEQKDALVDVEANGIERTLRARISLGKKGSRYADVKTAAEAIDFAKKNVKDYEALPPSIPEPVKEKSAEQLEQESSLKLVTEALSDGKTAPKEFGTTPTEDSIGNRKSLRLISGDLTKEISITVEPDADTKRYIGTLMKNGEISNAQDADPRELIKKLLKQTGETQE